MAEAVGADGSFTESEGVAAASSPVAATLASLVLGASAAAAAVTAVAFSPVVAVPCVSSSALVDVAMVAGTGGRKCVVLFVVGTILQRGQSG